MPRPRFRSADVACPWPGEGIFGFLVPGGDVSCHCPPWELAFLFPAHPAAGGAGHRVAAAVASILSATSKRRSFPG